VPNATAAIWKLLMVAEKTFRRLNAPELMRELYLGAVFVDGVRANEERGENRGRRLIVQG
jgi:putative transposase